MGCCSFGVAASMISQNGKPPFVSQTSTESILPPSPPADIRKKFHRTIFDFCLNLFLFIPSFFLYFVIFPPFYATRSIFNLFAMFVIRGEFCVPTFFTPTEMFFYKMQPTTNVCTLTFSKSMTKAKLCRMLRKRIFNNTYPRFAFLFTRFHQVVRHSCYNYYWCEFLEFDVENHVHLAEGIHSENDFSQFILDKYSYQLDAKFPLWKIYVIENFGDQLETIAVCLVHSVLADGVTFVSMLEDFMCDPPPKKMSSEKSFAYRSFINNAVISIFTAPADILNMCRRKNCKKEVKKLFSHDFEPTETHETIENIATENYNSATNGNLNAQALNCDAKQFDQVVFAEPVPLIAVQKLRLVSKATVNDIYLSCITGALKNQLGESNLPEIRCLVPINIRNPNSDPTVEQNITFMSSKLPLQKEGMIPSLWETKTSTQEAKFSSEMSIFAAVLQIFWCLLPFSFISSLCHHIYSKNFCHLSSLSMSPLYLSIEGSVIKSVRFFMAPFGDISLGFNLLSYADNLYLTITTRNDVPLNCNKLCADINSQV